MVKAWRARHGVMRNRSHLHASWVQILRMRSADGISASHLLLGSPAREQSGRLDSLRPSSRSFDSTHFEDAQQPQGCAWACAVVAADAALSGWQELWYCARAFVSLHDAELAATLGVTIASPLYRCRSKSAKLYITLLRIILNPTAGTAAPTCPCTALATRRGRSTRSPRFALIGVPVFTSHLTMFVTRELLDALSRFGVPHPNLIVPAAGR